MKPTNLAGAGIWRFGSGSWLWVRLKYYINIIIYTEKDQASEFSQYSFLKKSEKSAF